VVSKARRNAVRGECDDCDHSKGCDAMHVPMIQWLSERETRTCAMLLVSKSLSDAVSTAVSSSVGLDYR
jgi:hypothetical protein